MSSDSKTASDSGRPAPDEVSKQAPKNPGAGGDSRQQRLARALRDNLKKRKAQQRQRRGDGS